MPLNLGGLKNLKGIMLQMKGHHYSLTDIRKNFMNHYFSQFDKFLKVNKSLE